MIFSVLSEKKNFHIKLKKFSIRSEKINFQIKLKIFLITWQNFQLELEEKKIFIQIWKRFLSVVVTAVIQSGAFHNNRISIYQCEYIQSEPMFHQSFMRHRINFSLNTFPAIIANTDIRKAAINMFRKAHRRLFAWEFPTQIDL